MPSSSALWASIGPAITSPIAKIDGTLVLKWSSTSMRPSRSVWMPSASSPRPSVYGRRPMATRQASASSSEALPFFTSSTVNFTFPPSTVAPVTLVPSLNLMPCFFIIVRNFLAISLSVPGMIRSRNSTTVTSEPSLLQTDPISSPITPPPITIIFSGTLSISSAPVESTMTPPALSTGTGGRGVTSEPVAMRMFLVSYEAAAPSAPATLTLLGPAMDPLPLRYSTPYFLKRYSIPPVRAPTALDLAACMAPTSISTPETLMPYLAKSCVASW
mmetsp:Transcript_23077/g.52055  ORF Transcript_23077/g.52055 Transcript_23077/m.52055 type:complete len:273 (+) Transcript_23077:693-1511(+)